MVVEDEVKMAALMRRGLSEQGLTVDVAGERRARRSAMAGASDYDAIVLDVMLPGHRRLRDLPAAAPRGDLGAGPDADRARRARGPGRRPRRRRRRLHDQAVRLRRAAGPAARPGPPRQSRAPGGRSRSATCASTRPPTRSGAARPRSSSPRRSSSCWRPSCAAPATCSPASQLLEQAWEYDFEHRSNVVEVYIRYLRRKIDVPFGVKSIETVRGAGYRLRKDGGR